MRRRRTTLAVCAVLLLAAGLVLFWPWSELQDVGDVDLTISFVVTDADSGEPIKGVHVALYDEDGSATIVRTGGTGVATTRRRCTVTRRRRENPLTGVRSQVRSTAALPNWQVVMTAGGYRPPDPWRLWERFAAVIEVEGDSVDLAIPVALTPHSGTP